MRRDSIFYKLFQQSPTLLFELLTNPPTNTEAYRFDSVAIKEPKFEIDGVFLHQKMQVRVLCISVRYNSRRMKGFMKGYLQNHLYISTAIVTDLTIGR